MRTARLLCLALLVTAFPLILRAQQLASSSRDVKAVAALGQTISTAGWLPSSLPTAIAASGKMTRADGDLQSDSFTIKQRGPAQYRMDVTGTNSATTVVDGLSGRMLLPDGTKYRLPPHAAFSTQSPVFPFLSDVVNAVIDSDVEVQDVGASTIEGKPVRGIYLARHFKAGDQLAQFRELASPLTIWISQDSGLPVRIDFIRLADDNPYVQMRFSRSYADYRVVNGIAVPFQQEERFGDQLIYRVQLTNVQFNVPLLDSDFDSSKL